MKRAKQVELLAECLERTANRQPVMSDEEALVPVDKYLAPPQFQRERERLFRTALNVAAHASLIPSPGDFITRDLHGSPVLLVRHEDGIARAFLNVCRHRGAELEQRESGRCKRFVCPYHAWTYGTDGSLKAIRDEAGFPSLSMEDSGLVELPCVEAMGLLWVCPTPDIAPPPLDEPTRRLCEELDGLGCGDGEVFRTDTRIWKANWKLIVDGGLESYHFKIAHRNTIAGFFPDNVSTFEPIGRHLRTVLPRTSIAELAQQPKSDWSIRKHTHLVYAVHPNATVLVQDSHFELIVMTPISVDETRVEVATVVPKPGADGHSKKATAFWAANHEITKNTLDEDFELAEQIQRGMRSGANTHFRFARFEGALTHWHRMLDAWLAG